MAFLRMLFCNYDECLHIFSNRYLNTCISSLTQVMFTDYYTFLLSTQVN